MSSVIVRAATRILVGLLIVFSLWMLLRGHNAPGGGFIGGLIAATGFVLYAMAHGAPAARLALRVPPQSIAMAGLGVALVSGLAGLLPGSAPFTGLWYFVGATEEDYGLPLSTILVFDVGVYLVVLGSVLTLVFALEEEL